MHIICIHLQSPLYNVQHGLCAVLSKIGVLHDTHKHHTLCIRNIFVIKYVADDSEFCHQHTHSLTLMPTLQTVNKFVNSNI